MSAYLCIYAGVMQNPDQTNFSMVSLPYDFWRRATPYHQ